MKRILVKIWLYVISLRARKIIYKNAVLNGSGYKFKKKSRVYLVDGSCKKDVVLGDNVWFNGTISSQNGGKVVIGKYTRIGDNTRIMSVNSVVIGDYCAIANNITITDNNGHPVNPLFRYFKRSSLEQFGTSLWKHSDNKPVFIGDNVWIGDNARICKGVTIGDNVVIAACSIVTKDVPTNCIAAGNPAKIVKMEIDKIPYPTTCDCFNSYLEKSNK